MQIKPITPCLWFRGDAEAAVNLYTRVFPESSVGTISRYGKEGAEFHGEEPGTALMISFQLNGQPFSALNSKRAQFPFNESISFQIFCDTQKEIDHYWENLTANGGTESMCGWLKDPFGVSWQVVPSIMGELMSDPVRAGRVTQAFMQMKKLDIELLKNA